MLDDFNQEKQDQNLDPLSEEPTSLWGKKFGLICLAVALVGLFIFFASDSWSSDTKNNGTKEEVLDEIEQLKTRVASLETQLQAKNLPPPPSNINEDTATPAPMPMENLQSLIEQELQESATAQEPTPQEPPKAQEKPAPKKSPTIKAAQNYTVRKGDTLSKISLQFYGTPKKWNRIVEANKDRLGHNQTLKAGMTLVIPPKDS